MRKAIVVFCALVVLAPVAASAQSVQGAGTGAGSGSGSGSSQTQTTMESRKTTATAKSDDTFASRFPNNIYSNVHVELTISDQIGTAPVEKKNVSMIVANGSWGKIRASAAAYQKSASSSVVPVGLNVDARPFVSTDGMIRLELTLIYNPLAQGQTNDSAQVRPTELNQSLTVALQSGKPLVVSQAADPVIDRKMIVEVKATILK